MHVYVAAPTASLNASRWDSSRGSSTRRWNGHHCKNLWPSWLQEQSIMPWMWPTHELDQGPFRERIEHSFGLFRADLELHLDHLAGQSHAVTELIEHPMLTVCQGDIVFRCRDIRGNVPAKSLQDSRWPIRARRAPTLRSTVGRRSRSPPVPMPLAPLQRSLPLRMLLGVSQRLG